MSRLSFSATNRYSTCPKSYQLHYVERLREKSATAFLAFGSAIDNALNAILLAHKADKLKDLNYKDIFDKHWLTIEINGKEHSLPHCELVGYAKTDFVEELLTKEDLANIQSVVILNAPELTDKYSAKELKDLLEKEKSSREYKHFKKEHHQLLNYMNWISLRRKAHLMLDAYIRDIIPKIEEVILVQEKVQLGNEEDSFVGYVDLVAKFKGYPNPIVVDNKTAGRPYEEDSVRNSSQLATYCYALDLTHAAYAVMLKNISLNKKKVCTKCKFKSESTHTTCNNEVDGKRCKGEWDETVEPQANTQLFIDKVPANFQNMVIDNHAEISDAIKAKVFPKNLSKCRDWFGGDCSFLKLCHEGKSDNLEKLEDRNET